MDKKIKLPGGYITITTAGHANAYASKSRLLRHFCTEGHDDPVSAAKAWLKMVKDCTKG